MQKRFATATIQKTNSKRKKQNNGKGVFWVANKIDSCFKRNAENQPITLKVETMDQIPKCFFYKPKKNIYSNSTISCKMQLTVNKPCFFSY
jgi:hypothetical protein